MEKRNPFAFTIPRVLVIARACIEFQNAVSAFAKIERHLQSLLRANGTLHRDARADLTMSSTNAIYMCRGSDRNYSARLSVALSDFLTSLLIL